MGLLPSINLGFSSKKSSGTQTGTIKDQLESIVLGNESQNATKTSNSTVNASSSQNSAGASTGQSSSAVTAGTKTAESQTTTGSQFSSGVLDQLKSMLGGQAGAFESGSAGSSAALTASLEGLKFNAQDYAKGVTDSARVDLNDSLTASLNGLVGNTGGTADSNSMVALLQNKLRSATDAKLSGINSEALAAGSAIANKNQQSAAEIAQANQSPFLQLLQVLKGGETSQTGQSSGVQDTSQNTAGTTAQQTSEQSNSTSQQVSQILDLLNQLTNSSQSTNTDSTRTLDLKTTGKESGFSISGGLGK